MTVFGFSLAAQRVRKLACMPGCAVGTVHTDGQGVWGGTRVGQPVGLRVSPVIRWGIWVRFPATFVFMRGGKDNVPIRIRFPGSHHARCLTDIRGEAADRYTSYRHRCYWVNDESQSAFPQGTIAMEMSHSSFWPDCSCCWLLGYGVDPDDKERWAQKMISWDPQCVIHREEESYVEQA